MVGRQGVVSFWVSAFFQVLLRLVFRIWTPKDGQQQTQFWDGGSLNPTRFGLMMTVVHQDNCKCQRPWDQNIDKIASSNNPWGLQGEPLPVIHGVIRC